jgi:hypothetical protein
MVPVSLSKRLSTFRMNTYAKTGGSVACFGLGDRKKGDGFSSGRYVGAIGPHFARK